jgi:hypothetical protein
MNKSPLLSSSLRTSRASSPSSSIVMIVSFSVVFIYAAIIFFLLAPSILLFSFVLKTKTCSFPSHE